MIRLELPESNSMRRMLKNVLQHAYQEEEFFQKEGDSETAGAFQAFIIELEQALE